MIAAIHLPSLENVSRFTLAIDHTGNGYRKLIQSGINDSGVLNAVLAVAASHYTKWQRTEDRDSRIYLAKAFTALRERLSQPRLVYTESTVSTMLSLMSYEASGKEITYLLLADISADFQRCQRMDGALQGYNRLA